MYWKQNANNIYVAAHRGWSAKYPENTMIAFKKAMEIGVDQIETDVRVTKDGELVLIHDNTVDRTTNGTGSVCDFTYDELQQLDAGSWKGEEFTGTRIPKLVELMELVKDHPTMTLDIELKEYPSQVGEIAYTVCDRVLKIIDDYGYTDRVVINTFSGMLHTYIHEKYGDKYRLHMYYPVRCMGKLASEAHYSFGYCVCMFSQAGSGIATPEECAEMRARGIRTWAGAFVKDDATVDQAIACDCELITTNHCDIVLRALREKNRHK